MIEGQITPEPIGHPDLGEQPTRYYGIDFDNPPPAPFTGEESKPDKVVPFGGGLMVLSRLMEPEGTDYKAGKTGSSQTTPTSPSTNTTTSVPKPGIEYKTDDTPSTKTDSVQNTSYD